MQDNPAKPPRFFWPRGCADCPAQFTPVSSKQVRCPACQESRAAVLAREAHDRKMARRRADRAAARDRWPTCSWPGCEARLRKSNTCGRCPEHRYVAGEGMAECAQEGCGRRLRRDNRTGYCEEHKCRTAREPERTCAAPDGCDRKLRADNQSGYCSDHAELSGKTQEYRERYYAKLRQQNAKRPDTRRVCSVDECTNRLRSDNTVGRCTPHLYVPVDMPECSVEGCINCLTAKNKTGRCMMHRALYWVAAVCAAEGCEKTLNADCVTGYCREHRRLSDWRRNYNREYYQSNKAEFQEYARAWRAANGDDHRAAVRAWNAAHPEFKSQANARRRQRAVAGMTPEDWRESRERRVVIMNDPCFYCGSAVTHDWDHYFPLAKFGNDRSANIVRSCEPCNSHKYTTCGTAFLLLTGMWHEPGGALVPVSDFRQPLAA